MNTAKQFIRNRQAVTWTFLLFPLPLAVYYVGKTFWAKELTREELDQKFPDSEGLAKHQRKELQVLLENARHAKQHTHPSFQEAGGGGTRRRRDAPGAIDPNLASASTTSVAAAPSSSSSK